MEEQKVNTKIKDLTPTSKQVNLLAKVVALGEQKEITPRYGSPRRLVEATIGDETGTVILTLWEDQINQVAKDDVIQIDNGFVSLVRGHVRLNVGKYGTLAKTEQDLPEVNTSVDVSAQEHEQERRPRRIGSTGLRRGSLFRAGSNRCRSGRPAVRPPSPAPRGPPAWAREPGIRPRSP